MNLIRAHVVMIHGVGSTTVRMQHGTAGIGIAGIDLAVIDIIRGDILFRIRRNWPAAAAALASPLLSEAPFLRRRCRWQG